MNTWANTVLTDQGRALLAKLTQGNTLNITQAIAGAGFVTPGLLTKEEYVSNAKQYLSFRPISYPEDGKCAIPVVLKNDGLGAGYVATQIGIFAEDPDAGEILFLISQAADNDSGTIIPSETEMPGYSAEWTFYLQYGQAYGVTVVVDPSNAVTQAIMEEYVAESLKTMKDDIDMGGHKITNVAEPTQGSDVATRNFVEQHTLEGNLYVAVDYNNDGNIVLKPYVADEDEVKFKSHLENTNNPHRASWKQVGAAPGGYGIGELEAYSCASDTELDTVLTTQINSMGNQSFKRIALTITTTNTSIGGGYFYADIYKKDSNFASITVKTYLAGGRTLQRIWTKESGETSSTFKDWEWVNPPLVLGVEYRTTERFYGEPVYVKAINFGLGAHDDFKEMPVASDMGDLVRVEGYWQSATQPYHRRPFTSADFVTGIEISAGGKLGVNTDIYGDNYTGFPVVYYTKRVLVEV